MKTVVVGKGLDINVTRERSERNKPKIGRVKATVMTGYL